MTKKHTIGILGGLGPETTAHFYLDLISAATVRERPSVCIWSLPLNVKKEAEFISFGKHRGHFLVRLLAGARALERAGADRIVIPCNTVHEFHPIVQSQIGIPIVHLPTIVADEIIRRGWIKALLLATSETIRTKLYQTALAGRGVELMLPSSDDQQRLDLIIQGILGDRLDDSHQEFLQLLARRAGTPNVILGCTDLQLLFQPAENVIDSTSELVKHAARNVL